jgi:hypothetical protein
MGLNVERGEVERFRAQFNVIMIRAFASKRN